VYAAGPAAPESAPPDAAIVKPPAVLFCALLVMIAMSLFGLLVGAVSVPPDAVWRAIVRATPDDSTTQLIREIRAPRVALAVLVGAALSVSGALLQAFFQNPMAGPYTVGVSAGAGCAVVAVGAIPGLASGLAGGLALRVPAAFVGGLGAVLVVYALARAVRSVRSEGLLLVGIAVGSVLSSVTSLLLVQAPDGATASLFWMLGSFGHAKWPSVCLLGVLVLACSAHALWLARDLNVLLWGDEVAQSLGSPVRQVQRWTLVHSSLLAAGSVAVAGVIGFVGLMVPHIARSALRTADHRFVIPASAMLGGALVVGADAAARSLLAPQELPVGAITSICGAPFLVFLLTRGRHSR